MAEHPSPEPTDSGPNGPHQTPPKVTDDLTRALAAVLEMSAEAAPYSGSVPHVPDSAPERSQSPQIPAPGWWPDPPASERPAGAPPLDLDLDRDVGDPGWAPEAPASPALDVDLDVVDAGSAPEPPTAPPPLDLDLGIDDAFWAAEPPAAPPPVELDLDLAVAEPHWTNEPADDTDDEGWSAVPGPEPDPSPADLEEAGVGGPLHSALGELRRLNTQGAEETASSSHTGRAPSAGGLWRRAGGNSLSDRWPVWLSAAALKDLWVARRREWVPGLVVAAVVILAFAVVLSSGDKDRPDARVDSGPPPSATAPATTIDIGTVPPPIPETVAPPASDGPTADGSVARAPTARRSAPARSTPSRRAPVARGSGSPAAPAPPAPSPPAPSPPATSPPATSPPATSAPTPTTSPSPPTTRDFCDALPPDRRDVCRSRLND